VLNGRNLWITNGKGAGVFILFPSIDPSAGYKGIDPFFSPGGGVASSMSQLCIENLPITVNRGRDLLAGIVGRSGEIKKASSVAGQEIVPTSMLQFVLISFCRLQSSSPIVLGLRSCRH